MNANYPHRLHHVVIVGGGFGGLYAAQALHSAPVRVTLVDRRNFHLFQPLLYQVATGGLSPGDIASPLRAILNQQENARVLKAEVVDFDPRERRVILHEGELSYDTLIIAAGTQTHYFGNEQWAKVAPGLKTVEDALEIRRRILSAFEAAEREPHPEERKAWLTFVVVGGGPTGVELAGAIAELARGTLKNDFQNFDPAEAQVILLEGMETILPAYPNGASGRATQALSSLGVQLRNGTLVTEIDGEVVTFQEAGQTKTIKARTALWAAGMKASPLGEALAARTGAELDRSGRVIVNPDLSLPDHPDIFVIGDLAHFSHQDGTPLPGVAPVAMQQGRYVAELLQARLKGEPTRPFRYQDKGMLAVIGRNAAVAVFGRRKFSGFLAWLVWCFVHIWYLIEYDNKARVFLEWSWNYFTRKRGARLITGEELPPSIKV